MKLSDFITQDHLILWLYVIIVTSTLLLFPIESQGKQIPSNTAHGEILVPGPGSDNHHEQNKTDQNINSIDPSIPNDWVNHVIKDIKQSEYNFSQQLNGSWSAPNRAQNLRSIINEKGLEIISRSSTQESGGSSGWKLGLILVEFGREGFPESVPLPCIKTHSNRVELFRDSIIEWYVNTGKGMEQGFTINNPPEQGGGDLPLVLSMSISGGLSPGLMEEDNEILFTDGKGGVVLRYADLHVYDFDNHQLAARFMLSPGKLHILVNDENAKYPLTIDPLMTTPAWTAESNQAGAYYGFSVATAGDVNGDHYSDIIVGAMYYDQGDSNEGKVFVYHGSITGLKSSADWSAESNMVDGYFGHSVATAGDVNGDGYDDVVVGAYNYSNGETNEGRAYVYHGSGSGLGSDPAWTDESDQAGAFFGWSAITAGDVNNDGYDDIIVGAAHYDNGEFNEGGAFVYHGSVSGLALSPAWTAESDQDTAFFGSSVATAGDVNSDGYADVIVGAYWYTNGEFTEGRAYVYHGSSTGLAVTPAWTDESNQAIAQFGYSVATAGDVNGDGYADIIVGAHMYDNGESDEGRVFVYHGSTTGLASTPAWNAESNQADSYFGRSVATAGDVNGDGYADVIVGAISYDNGESDEGLVFVYNGSSSGLAATPSWTAESNQTNANLGNSVATAGDVNGDGYSDVIVGAHMYDNGESEEGRAYVFYGSAAGLDLLPAWTGESNQIDSYFGRSVATAGDVNGDGYSDVIVGAYSYDNGELNEGRVFVYHGSATGLDLLPSWTAESNQNNAYFGGSVANAGDVNGDGYSDVIAGADGYDNGEVDEGRAFVYHGSATGLDSLPAWTAESNQSDSHFGNSVATAGDVNGDGYSDVIAGVYRYDNGEVDEGSASVYHGSKSGLEASPAWTGESNQAEAFFGVSVASAGDVNGDGYSDIIAGAPMYDNGEVDEGRAYVYHGSETGLPASPAWTAESNQVAALYGRSVAAAGDVNGDGYSDVIVGAHLYDNGESDEGRAYVYHGSGTGLMAIYAWTAESNQLLAHFGNSAATAGDVNGDGYSDVIVGATFYDNGETDEGSAFVYHGSVSGLAASPEWTAESNQSYAYFGDSAATAGDVNGDGYSDIIVGAPHYENGEMEEGHAFVFFGNQGDGLDRIPQQARFDDLGPIDILGMSDSFASFRLKALGRTPSGRGNVRLEWEIKPLGAAFDASSLRQGTWINTGNPVPLIGSARELNEIVDALLPGTVYHWRLRIVSENPFFPRSPWFCLPYNNKTETDLRTGTPVIPVTSGFSLIIIILVMTAIFITRHTPFFSLPR